MSNLRNMIQASKAAKKELTASTIRMPRELYSEIEGLADQLEVTKQEIMLRLLEEGVAVARDELNLRDGIESIQSNFHLLNTNKGNRIEDHDYMIKGGVAAAFYDPWKFNIDRIGKGDVVFLYENGKGIVAYGTATGDVKVTDQEGDEGECHYQNLEKFIVLDEPVSASKIKRILGRNIVFLRTMSSLPDGQKIIEKIS